MRYEPSGEKKDYVNAYLLVKGVRDGAGLNSQILLVRAQ